jgi:putative ABC transport system permease protein
MVKAASPEVMPAVEKSITALLRQRHRIREGQDNDFTLRNLTAVADSAAETTRVMSLLLGAIASVSLLVGGIGIMNIMLVSVTERTREIGIRMAIGARQKDILSQFLLEAIIISIAGCLIGLLLGVGGAILVNVLASTAVVISGSSVLVAFGVAAGIGVFFGFYPARKAAALDPIEALRYQ